MVKVPGPLFSLSARGWLGRVTYGRIGIVKNPYPIGLFGFALPNPALHARWGDPLFEWSGPGIEWSDKVVSSWSDDEIGWDDSQCQWSMGNLFPLRFRVGHYYSIKGWCYRRARTWHGIVWQAIRPPISAQPKTLAQEANKAKFAAAVAGWQALTGLEKGIWNSYNYPKHPSGYNRFLRAYLLDKI